MKIGNYGPEIRRQLVAIQQAAKSTQVPQVCTFTDNEADQQRDFSKYLHSQRCGGGRRVIRKKIGGEG